MRSRSSEVFPPGAEVLRLKDEHRQLLKRPLGRLITGPPNQVSLELGRAISARKGPLVVVGDVVSSTVSPFSPNEVVYVTDGKTLRELTSEVRLDVDRVVRCRNEAGTISREAFEALEEAIRSGGRVHLVVEGEEDLLALAAVYLVPSGGLVVYGQPGEGVVVVEVDDAIRSFAYSVLKAMVPER
ncbi:MAG: DUF359 domain-containing protein [Nitrososphaerota archaeon]